MVTFTTDPRIAYAQGMRKNYLQRALSPIQLPQNPYGGSPLASALQRVTEGYLAGQEGRRAAELQKAQSSARSEVLASLLGATRARTPAGGQYFEQFQAPVPGIAPGPGATQTQIRRVAIGDDGAERPVSAVSAEKLQIAGIDPIQFKMLYDDARIKGDAATQAALEKELRVKLGEATRALALNPNDENTLNQVQQIRALLDPAGIAKETIERKQTLGDTEAERLYQATLREDALKRHQADRQEDRAWKKEDDINAQLLAAERRMEEIALEEARAVRNQEWELGKAKERRRLKILDDIKAYEREIIEVYDRKSERNIKIRVGDWLKNQDNYDLKQKEKAPRKISFVSFVPKKAWAFGGQIYEVGKSYQVTQEMLNNNPDLLDNVTFNSEVVRPGEAKRREKIPSEQAAVPPKQTDAELVTMMKRASAGDLPGIFKTVVDSFNSFFTLSDAYPETRDATSALNQLRMVMRVPLVKAMSARGGKFTIEQADKVLPGSNLGDAKNISRIRALIPDYRQQLDVAKKIKLNQDIGSTYEVAATKVIESIEYLLPQLEQIVSAWDNRQAAVSGGDIITSQGHRVRRVGAGTRAPRPPAD